MFWLVIDRIILVIGVYLRVRKIYLLDSNERCMHFERLKVYMTSRRQVTKAVSRKVLTNLHIIFSSADLILSTVGSNYA